MSDNSLVKHDLNFVTKINTSQSEWNDCKIFAFLLETWKNIGYPCSIKNAQFTSICTKKLKSKIIEQWFSGISGNVWPHQNQSGKLTFYNLFNTSFHREPYTDFLFDFNLRRKFYVEQRLCN